MREAMIKLGGDPEKINPLVPVDLVIDHSVIVDEFGTPSAFARNVELEYQRNGERYRFLKWGQQAFKNFRVVPPGTGICHQVNLEYLAQTVWTNSEDGVITAYPDTCVGTDSHTTMVAANEWRDYAIDHLSDRAVFSVFRRASEVPLFQIVKDPKLARRQGAFSVIAAGGRILKRGQELGRVLGVFDSKLKVIEA